MKLISLGWVVSLSIAEYLTEWVSKLSADKRKNRGFCLGRRFLTLEELVEEVNAGTEIGRKFEEIIIRGLINWLGEKVSVEHVLDEINSRTVEGMRYLDKLKEMFSWGV